MDGIKPASELTEVFLELNLNLVPDPLDPRQFPETKPEFRVFPARSP